MRISDWSSDVCSSDLLGADGRQSAWHRLRATVLDHSRSDLGGRTGGRSMTALTMTVDDLFDVPESPMRRHLLLLAGVAAVAAVIVAAWGALSIGSHTPVRSEEHTSELQSLMRISYAVFCLKKKNITTI